MSILNAACCCGIVPTGCLPQADFSISIRSRGAAERWHKTTSVSFPCPPSDPPACSMPDLTCVCPDITCLDTFEAKSGWCEPEGIDRHYISSFDMNETAIYVPFINTTTETVVADIQCKWFADISGTITQSGLTYTGQRNVDNNQAAINFTRDFSGCSCCCFLTVGASGTESQTINVSYGHRCTYLIPPAYMKVQRDSGRGFLNWTYEITAGVFIVKNASGVVQGTYTLAGNTMAAAVTAIDALPGVVCIKTFTGTIPADTFDASMMINRANQLLPLSPLYDSLYLVAVGTIVQTYQDGAMSPYWRVANGLTCDQRFYLKAGCSAANDLDYTGGTNAAAELIFCTGICTEFADWETSYDPTTGIGDVCGGWNYLSNSTFGPCLTNYPTGYYAVVPGKGCAWVQTAPCAEANPPNSWVFTFGAFGNRATTNCDGQTMCSDDSPSTPTSCTATFGVDGCDFCSCSDEIGKQCNTEIIRQGWKVVKSFSILRL